jgi:WD40 repeat protein
MRSRPKFWLAVPGGVLLFSSAFLLTDNFIQRAEMSRLQVEQSHFIRSEEIDRSEPVRPGPFWCVAYSPDGKALATGGGSDGWSFQDQDGELAFWDAKTGKKLHVLRQDWAVRRMAYSPDGRFLVVSDFGGSTRLLDTASGKPLLNFTPHSNRINGLAIAPDGTLVAAGSADCTITLSEITGKDQGTLLAENSPVLSVALSPDDRWLLAGCEAKAYLFDLAHRDTPKPIEAYNSGPQRFVEAVAFSPDGRSFVTAGLKAQLWENGTATLIRDFATPGRRIRSLLFASDGNAVFAVDDGGRLLSLSTATGSLLASAQAHEGPSVGLALSADGRKIVTIGRTDFQIKIWNADTLQLQATYHR